MRIDSNIVDTLEFYGLSKGGANLQQYNMFAVNSRVMEINLNLWLELR